ncbi:Tetratricopeptide repeat-containing protein [Nocardiopsis gilva]|nr:tetratricopeptide repeat protein [Nocardiopsis gilva]
MIHGDVHFHYSVNPPAPTRPSQLPLAPPTFTDRYAELNLLGEQLRQARCQRETRLVVVIGTGGVGKTALAVHFLRDALDNFPDGQLHADLAGFTPSTIPVDPGHALGTFLRSLGIAPAEIPHDTASRAALFRSRTQGRRLAVLLDNAASAAQVLPLLPGNGGHLVVITTRRHLARLVTHGAQFLEVRPLDTLNAVRLLSVLVGHHRDDLGAEDSRRLAVLCGGLPLAVCAAAGRLVLRPGRPAARMIADLAGERRRLGALSQDDEVSVRAVFDVSHAALPGDAARLYRLLGLHPGRTFDVAAAAALAETDEFEAEDLLEYLVSASLLEERATSGRYDFHDLVRIHARERAHEHEAPAELDAAFDRLVDHYLRTAVSADLRINPGRWRLNPLFDEVRGHERFADQRSALLWLETELPTLGELVRLTCETERHSATWQLCESLWGFFVLRKHYDEWVECHRSGLVAAEALGDHAAQAWMLTALASASLGLGRPDQAEEDAAGARRRWREAGHRLGEAAALDRLGTAALARESPRTAITYFSEALKIHDELGRSRGVALMRRYLGEAYRDGGDSDAANAYFDRARHYFSSVGDEYHTARTLTAQATGHLMARRLPEAEEALDEALRLQKSVGAHHEVARVHSLLGRLASMLGRWDDARKHLREALAIYSGLGARQAGAIAQTLAELDEREP